jgi:hypothetical protein
LGGRVWEEKHRSKMGREIKKRGLKSPPLKKSPNNYSSSLPLATVTRLAKAAGSLTAISANILRFISTPDFFKPLIN